MPDFEGARYPAHTFHSGLQQTLALAIRRCGLTERELASRAGMSRTYINELLNGKHGGHIQSWSRLLEAADIEIEWKKKS